MYDAGKIIAGLVVFFGLMSFPVLYSAANGDIDYTPELNLPADGTSCIESTEYMRANHMYMLLQWRDEVVRSGERTYIASDGQEYTKSLTDTCLKCHSPKTDFCDRCHDYVDVEPDCWSCHNDPEGGQ